MSGSSDFPGSSLRTVRRRVAGLGAAHSGTHHFWLQRVTALANVPLTLAFLAVLVCVAGEPPERVLATIGQPIVAIILLLAIVSITTHMRAGMQVVIEDYVHNEGAKVLALVGNTFFCAAMGCAGVFAILKISFGG
ncbi:succinate dehydrogenase, hydrophobic membrane anchor protein [Ancylobacter sp. Lp-2]|uniref:succinate dehydrogenase, hydrophobic membrane anchor protein n=1 Tax=Ancylobacter sp. Lp-2 TaxID=2881339 RepID=UPI001E5FA912|nr:succinate dehydrogenase, hydrophobic membrane anchor protein [Ancylobacter sp. Lp-2]MCB4771686.1 succinate dehydrogenase, hydrophobic membrane anchor protein [Ancylobacter sp. Lp-2]